MKKRYWMYAISLIAVVFLVEYDVARRMNAKVKNITERVQTSNNVAPQASAVRSPVAVPARTKTSFFESQFLKEAQKISELQNDPKLVDQKMDQLARSMSSVDLQKLSVVMQNENENGDQRALAVELIARFKTPEAITALKEFVVRRDGHSGPNREFESVLRAQAIEGIAAFPQKELALSYLNLMANQVDESFLKDRIVRSEENLKGRAPSTEQQDESALKQLVQ